MHKSGRERESSRVGAGASGEVLEKDRGIPAGGVTGGRVRLASTRGGSFGWGSRAERGFGIRGSRLRGAGGSRVGGFLLGGALVGFLGGALIGGGLPCEARAQGVAILLSTEADAAFASGRAGVIEDEDLLIYRPASDLEPSLYFHDGAWESVLGDADGDGLFDEEPTDVDALWIEPTASAATIFDVLVSFSTDRRFASGQVARDGDVIQILPDGDFAPIFLEEFFEQVTGTSGVDIDALAMTPAGGLVFSFADTETTTLGSLTAQNGGSPDLLDGTVFSWSPGALEAAILYSESDLVSRVNQALGRNLSSIGDCQGLACDPIHGGEFLFVVSSKTSGVEGTVFTTVSGGQVADLGGGILNGEGIGFSEPETLDALAWNESMAPLLLPVLDPREVSISSQSEVVIEIFYGRPHATVQVVASPAQFPITPMLQDARLQGAGFLFVDPGSRLFRNSRRQSRFRVQLDEFGQGRLILSTSGVASGLARVVQVIDPGSRDASYSLIVETID